MIPLSITLNIDEAPWDDLAADCTDLGAVERIGRLPRGTIQGGSVIMLQIRMSDGKQYVAQTTLNLMENAMRAIRIREGMEKAHDN